MNPISQPAALKAEIVKGIPVKSPVDSVVRAVPQPAAANPIAQPAAADSVPVVGEDKELDMILQDVNHSVKRAEDGVEERFAHLNGVRKKAANKKAKIEETDNGSPPILATAAALVMTAILIAAAVMMFKAK